MGVTQMTLSRAQMLALYPSRDSVSDMRPPPAVADSNRIKRRALVKALGKRQFKKLYRNAE